MSFSWLGSVPAVRNSRFLGFARNATGGVLLPFSTTSARAPTIARNESHPSQVPELSLRLRLLVMSFPARISDSKRSVSPPRSSILADRPSHQPKPEPTGHFTLAGLIRDAAGNLYGTTAYGGRG